MQVAELTRENSFRPAGRDGVIVQNDPVNFTDPLGLLTTEAQTIVNSLQGSTNNDWAAWQAAFVQRDRGDSSLALRDAEHYLYAQAFVSSGDNGKIIDWLIMGPLITPGYEIYKLLGLASYASPPSWNELSAGYEGAWNGLWKEKTTKRCP